jgi:hypothetical protein
MPFALTANSATVDTATPGPATSDYNIGAKSDLLK